MPQRFQVISSDSPFEAGYRLLALTLATSAGAALSGVSMQKLKIAPFYILLGAATLQTIGLSLMSTLTSLGHTIPAAMYGYQVIIGLGFGTGLGTTTMMIPMVVDNKDMGSYNNRSSIPNPC